MLAILLIRLSLVVENIANFVAADFVILSCDVHRHINLELVVGFAVKKFQVSKSFYNKNCSQTTWRAKALIKRDARLIGKRGEWVEGKRARGREGRGG